MKKIEFKPIDDAAFDAVNKFVFEDILNFGIGAYHAEVKDGKPHIRYVDPISDELRDAIYNAEHTDSQTKTHKL